MKRKLKHIFKAPKGGLFLCPFEDERSECWSERSLRSKCNTERSMVCARCEKEGGNPWEIRFT